MLLFYFLNSRSYSMDALQGSWAHNDAEVIWDISTSFLFNFNLFLLFDFIVSRMHTCIEYENVIKNYDLLQ